MRRALLPIAVVAALLSAGCGMLRKPDMSQTAGIATLREPQRPLIVIHGFLGAKLRDRDSGKVAWGTMGNVLRGKGGDDLALGLDDASVVPGENLEPYEIYKSLWGVEYYNKILRSLETAGGYRVGNIDDPRPGDNAFVFVYDWRRDNVDSARRLGEAIDRLKSTFGDDVRFDLLTHSQGGLIARYYVKYGGAALPGPGAPLIPTMAGAAHVNQVLMLGTPNRGCLEAFKILHLGVKKVFRPMRPDVIFTMPSVYQMLPPRGTLLFADARGRSLEIDLYEPANWERHGWSVFHPSNQALIRKKLGLARSDRAALELHNRRLREFLGRALEGAERFHEALDRPAPAGTDVPYYAFGGDCVSTLKTALVIEKDGRRELVFDSKHARSGREQERLAELLFGPGDGTVLMQSLLAIPEENAPAAGTPVEFHSAFFICENHGLLTNNPIFQNNLLYLLLWPGDHREPEESLPPPLPPVHVTEQEESEEEPPAVCRTAAASVLPSAAVASCQPREPAFPSD